MSQSGPPQIICSSTERSRLRSFLRTDDAGLSPAIHRRCLTSEEWRQSRYWETGVTFTNHLSMSDHVRDVIARCGQTLYALKVLRTHGMSDDSLIREIYEAVVLAKLMYASRAWWGFTAASDRQQIDAFVRRGVRFGLYNAGDPSPSQLNHRCWRYSFHQNIG